MRSYVRASVLKVSLVLLAGLFLSASDAQATRIHVATFGEMTSGHSVPGDWSAQNCYPNIAVASLHASANDSILLFDESHDLNQPINISRFLGNADLDMDIQGATLNCGALAQMTIPVHLLSFKARGITFLGDGAESDLAAFLCAHGLNVGGTIQFEFCEFRSLTGSNEYTGSGSCINGWGDGRGTTVVIDNCRFEGNSTRGIGGAIFFGNGYDIQISSSEFIENLSRPGPDDSVGSGGALAVASYHFPTAVSCSNTLFSGNKSWGPGGTLYIADGTLSLTECEISDSASAVEQFTHWSAGAGIMYRRTGGSHFEDTTLVVERCLFQRNIGEIIDNPYAGDGGGILARGETGRVVEVTVRNSTFLDNYNSQGAGLYVGRFANATVEYCRFHGNSSFMQGGATYKGGVFEDNLGETAVYRYCEFSSNRAGVFLDGSDSTDFGRGGAFSTRFFTRAEFHNCTFYDNSAHGPAQDGDAIMLPNEGYVFDSDLQRCDFINSVFYGAEGNSVQVVAQSGAIGRFENCAYEMGQIQFGDTDPMESLILDTFPFAGPLDLEPGVDSPLIDAGQDEGQLVDLSGTLVPFGPAPDIGAFEAQYVLSEVSPGENLVSVGLQGWPNPFTGAARFRFTAPEVNPRIEIFDLAGRRVRTVLASRSSTEEFSAMWDGKDDQGRRQPAGTYFCKVRGKSSDLTMRLVLLR
jgi:hypothetical protein